MLYRGDSVAIPDQLKSLKVNLIKGSRTASSDHIETSDTSPRRVSDDKAESTSIGSGLASERNSTRHESSALCHDWRTTSLDTGLVAPPPVRGVMDAILVVGSTDD